MHTKCVIKLQALGPEGAKGRSSREKRGLENTCSPHQSERSILIEFLFKSEGAGRGWGGGGGNGIQLEKRNV